MSFNVGPRVVSATGGSIKRVGNYRIHTFPSELVTDGLVLNLDAGDPRSYPGSGTTWTDLSGNGNNGTFGASTAAPTYNNANGGSIVFDGSNDLVTLTGTESFNFGSGDFTIECWVYFNVVNVNQLFISKYLTWGSNVDFFIRLAGSNSKISFSSGPNVIDILSTNSVTAGGWNHICVSRNSNTTTLYINGISNGTHTGLSSIPNNKNELRLGISHDNDEPLNGRISNFRIYKGKGLSAAEVAQNYDALKVRYTSYTNTFTPTCGGGSGKVEVLCVAGGGAGGNGTGSGYESGGGGAGGLLYNSAFTVSSNTGIALTVGAGGASATSSTPAANGGNSVFGALTAIGGGGGATAPAAGSSGGSGGGGSHNQTGGGSGTAGQGFSGATPAQSSSGGGGGGAGGPGKSTSSYADGSGGIGLAFSISGSLQYYAGGGGGSNHSNVSGGLGGGGAGTSSGGYGNGSPGGTNTGGGGGGANQPATNTGGGAGGSGIIIVRYPATDYNVELLVVGGGGGGGGNTGDSWNGGGGGAGGLIYYSSYPVSAGTKYTVTVGAGGTAGISTSSNNGSTTTQGANGGNSILGPLVAIGGGGGGASSGNGTGTGTKNNGLNGGSGGGGAISYNAASKSTGGVGVSGQGNSGGQGDTTGTGYSGGGGGAGGPGTGPGVHNVTNFGPGLVFSITGSSVSYAQGGQGGRDPVTNAAANSGTGGDGARSAVDTLGQSGAGGSGIIIIAYQGPQRGVGGTVDTTSRPGYTLHKFTTTGTDFFIP